MPALLKWVTFAYALFMTIPFVGGLSLFSSPLLPSLVSLVLHVAAWLLLKRKNLPVTGNVFGIFASIFGIIDIMGWILHGTTVFLLLIEGVVMHTMREEFETAKISVN